MSNAKILKNSKKDKILITINIFLLLFLIFLDQITKIIIERNFKLYETIPIINNFFSLTFITNKGAAWGMFAGQGFLLLSIAIITFALIIIFFRKLTEGYAERYFALTLLVSGIIGNSIDRFLRGEVIDFLDFYIKLGDKFHHWPAFNVADIAICVGVGIFILSSLIRPDKSKEATADAQG